MRTKGNSYAVALLLIALTTSAARADDLPGVRATGVDAAGNVLAPGSVDPHWSIVAVPAGTSFTAPSAAVVAVPHPVYVPNDAVGAAGSSWIGATSNLRNATSVGNYVFRTTFDLTGFDPATAQLVGRVAVDNSVVDVVLNGVSLGAAGGQFRDWSPLAVDSGFVAGVNVLELVVGNFGADPSGLRVELAGTADAVATAVTVDVDVRPFSDENVVNARSRGKLRVAVLSSADFDATSIAPTSVSLCGASAAAGCRGGDPLAMQMDVDGDGRDDLLLHFAVEDLALTVDTTELPFAGLTADGVEVVGTGTVRVVECAGVREMVTSLLGRWATRGWGHDDGDDDDDDDDGRDWRRGPTSWSRSSHRR